MTGAATDVCVVGGGPSGTVTARALAKLGYRVCLIDRKTGPHPCGVESFPRIVETVLGQLDLWRLVDQTWSSRNLRTHVRWQDTVSHRPDDSFLVDRRHFDRVLLKAAADEGVMVLSPARARRPTLTGDIWTISFEQCGQRRSVVARYMVDASGRRASCPPIGPKTVVMCGRWEGSLRKERLGTSVEAGRSCWYWAAPISDCAATALVFIESFNGLVRDRGRDQESRREFYRSLVDESQLVREFLEEMSLAHLSVHDATSRLDQEPITHNMIKVGDRVLAMDPLSSQGIAAAIRSGLQASRVIHTILSGGDAEAAVEFYQTAVVSSANRHVRHRAEIYATQRLYESGFWTSRSSSGLIRSAKVVNRARISDNPDLELSPFANIVTVPVLEGDTVRREAALAHPLLEQPVAWLGGLLIAPVVMAIRRGSATSILEMIARLFPKANASGVLEWLIEHEILISITESL